MIKKKEYITRSMILKFLTDIVKYIERDSGRRALMWVQLLFKGMIAGLAIAMPVGPIDFLCIRNSIHRGMFYGLMTGIGVAIADAVCGLIAGFSVVAVESFFETHNEVFKWGGALFLICLGIYIFFSKSSLERKEIQNKSYTLITISTFLITMSNPMTIIGLTAIYASLGITHEDKGFELPFFTTIGVFLGSTLWWIILSFFASYFKDRLGIKFLNLLNRISGTILFCFGLFVAIYT